MYKKTFVAVAVAQIIAAGTAYAQTAQNAPAATGGGLEEIVVTAQRREQPLQDVPLTVTAFTPEVLQNRAINNAQDMQVMAPALKMSNNVTTPTNLSLSYRGSAQQDASLLVAESPIGIYVDDIYVGRMNGNNVQFPDVDNIEFLHGPQGTLYGRNTLQGAVTFNSRNPGKDPWTTIDAGAGNYDQYRGDFSVGRPIGDTGWAASVAGLYNYKNGEWFNIGTNSKWGKEENTGFRGKLHYFGSDVLDVTLFSSVVHSENDALALVPFRTLNDPGSTNQFNSNNLTPVYGNYTVNSPSHNYGVPTINNVPEGSVLQTISGLNVSYKLPFGGTIKSITGYETTKDTFTSNFAGTDPITSPITAADGLDHEIGGEVMNVKQITEELQLLGKTFNDRLDYLVGAYYLRESGHQQFGWYGFGLGPLSTSGIQSTTDSYSLFTQESFKITDALSATAGVRWTEDKKHIDLEINQVGLLAILGPLGIFGANDIAPLHYQLPFVAITPKAELDYKLPSFGSLDSGLVYLNAGRGFKSGGVSGINIFNLDGSQVPYQPEENWTYELGVKSEWFDHRLRVNADYFIANIYNIVFNETVQIAPGVFAFPEANAGDARTQGLEMEISAVPMEGLSVFVNPAFETGKYTGLAPGASPILSQAPHTATSNTCGSTLAPSSNGYCVANPKPPQLPWFAFTVGADYKHAMPIGSDADSKFIAGFDWFKTASYTIGATGDYIVSAYDRLNGYVGVELTKELQFRIQGKNLQDRNTLSTGARGLGGFYELPPREILLTFSYKAAGF